MKKNWRKIAATLLAAATLAGALSGCSTTETSTTDTPQATLAPIDTSVNPSEPPEGVALKEDIVMGIANSQTSLDAAESGTNYHSYLWRMMQDTLTHFNNDTKELEPWLATEWSTEDGQTYVFKLRDGVKFHNGETLKASDVVFTFERMEGTAFGNSIYTSIQSIEALDDLTVQMTLTAPNMDWPYMMCLPWTSIMNEKAVTENLTEGTAVGTGPWQLDSYEFNNYTTLRAFDESWRGAPNAETFTFRTIPENSARLIALQNGEIDICEKPASIEYDIVRGDDSLELLQYDSSSLNYLAFNTQTEPGSMEDFRKAIAYALDIDALIEVVVNGNATKATSVWGRDQYGYVDMGGYTRDLDKAREYLAKAFPNGGASLEISIIGSHKTLAQMIQAELGEIGINVTINELDGAGIAQAFSSGDYQACTFSIGLNIYGDDTRRLLDPSMSSNTAKYDNEEVLGLMDAASAEMDEATRLEDYAQVQEILYEDAPYIPLYFPRQAIALNAGTGGIDIYSNTHHDFSMTFVPAE